MAQSVAVFMYAMSLHGYGAKRLKEFYDWYCAIMNAPADLLGKTPKTRDVVKLMSSKYGLDFGRVKPNFKPFKEWYRDDT